MKKEKEKMLNGESYDPNDEELITRWHLAKKLIKQFNSTDTSEEDEIEKILYKLLGFKGKNTRIVPPFFVDYGTNIYLGDDVEINMNCVFLDCNKIVIGDKSGIGPNVQIYAVTHPIKPKERIINEKNENLFAWKTSSAPVNIGKNVWIGGGAIILQGVTIGDNTTIGAGSVVTKSIPKNSVAVGNPCKVIRKI
ncbi:putative acetyltransferase [Methanobrevibacter cuticularis]|uniref:Putative acetyltransferase n=1 Tax=Methanobrevibacter cuticularis TaxID=47311 RepID=A0A166F3G0_9EURY|nr:sugar O-acetyltransferase [Methanobrevibacter cuticularis]KZX17276.1 putative acetyltransferase [Methanobrevibacter cuticularis]